MSWHIISKCIKIFLIVFLIYLIAGVTIPFILPVKVSQDYIENFDLSKYYHDGERTNDRAAIIETSKEALDIRMEMIYGAKESIIFSTFDIRSGNSCNDVFAALYNAAERGVKVQILVDGLNGQKEVGARLLYYAAGTHPNIEIRFYNQFNLLKPWTFNGRMHDKYIITDDRLLLLGGRNTFDYFLGEYNLEKMSFDREIFVYNEDIQNEMGQQAASPDRNKNVQGNPAQSVITQLNNYFQQVWELDVCKTVFDSYHGNAKRLEEQKSFLRQHFKTHQENNPQLYMPDIDYTEKTIAVDKITLLSNPTHIMSKEPHVWYDLYRLMMGTEERVYIITPYAVLNKAMYRGFGEINEQVHDFKMLLNSVAVGDNFMASSDYTLNRKKIYKTGVDVYEFQGTNSSHGKSLLIDHNITVIGSYNFDLRSTYLSTELMLVVEGEEFNQALEAIILGMEQQSLKRLPDGTYEDNPDVTQVTLPAAKQILFGFTSVTFQLIRYLL